MTGQGAEEGLQDDGGFLKAGIEVVLEDFETRPPGAGDARFTRGDFPGCVARLMLQAGDHLAEGAELGPKSERSVMDRHGRSRLARAGTRARRAAEILGTQRHDVRPRAAVRGRVLRAALQHDAEWRTRRSNNAGKQQRQLWGGSGFASDELPSASFRMTPRMTQETASSWRRWSNTRAVSCGSQATQSSWTLAAAAGTTGLRSRSSANLSGRHVH